MSHEGAQALITSAREKTEEVAWIVDQNLREAIWGLRDWREVSLFLAPAVWLEGSFLGAIIFETARIVSRP